MSEADYKEWITLAQHDIDTAELLLNNNGHADIIIYHLHQAVEKLLKALLVKSDKSIEKTHFLDKILNQIIKDYPQLTQIEEEILAINLYLPKLRYPYGDEILLDEAKNVFSKFNKIKKLLFNLLK